ncbi:MAG: hypothetical protein AAFN74_08445 [Myxococcota bacterium]
MTSYATRSISAPVIAHCFFALAVLAQSGPLLDDAIVRAKRLVDDLAFDEARTLLEGSL